MIRNQLSHTCFVSKNKGGCQNCGDEWKPMYYTKWDIWTEFANREGKGIVVNFLVKHPPEADISLNN